MGSTKLRRRAISLAVVVVLATMGGASSSPQILPPSLFIWQRGEGSDRIFRAVDPLLQASPWSSDGSLLVIRSGRLLIADPATGSRRRLETRDLFVQSATWSPDATRVAFDAFDAEGNGDIYAVGVDGSGIHRLTTSSRVDSDPVWSPDGEKIAFLRSGRGIFVMDPDGGEQQMVVHRVRSELNWSPDSTQILFIDDLDVWRVNRDGTGRRNLTTSPRRWEYVARWAPSGERFVFVTYSGVLLSLTRDGKELRRILGAGRRAAGAMEWSPDGRRIAFEYGRDIFTIHPDGTGLRNITAGVPGRVYWPRWSPDSTRVSFFKYRLGGVGELYRSGGVG